MINMATQEIYVLHTERQHSKSINNDYVIITVDIDKVINDVEHLETISVGTYLFNFNKELSRYIV